VAEEDQVERTRQAIRLMDATLQAQLRSVRLLAGDDDLVEVMWADSGLLAEYDERHADEPEVSTLKGGSCCFSSRRLYFPNAKIFADLEWVWRADSSEKTLSVALSHVIAGKRPANQLAASDVSDTERTNRRRGLVWVRGDDLQLWRLPRSRIIKVTNRSPPANS
jgi:hypothetical protein